MTSAYVHSIQILIRFINAVINMHTYVFDQ